MRDWPVVALIVLVTWGIHSVVVGAMQGPTRRCGCPGGPRDMSFWLRESRLVIIGPWGRCILVVGASDRPPIADSAKWGEFFLVRLKKYIYTNFFPHPNTG